MKRAVLSFVLAGLIISGGIGMAEENETSGVKILSPKNGDVVGDTFELKYELKKTVESHHPHVYLDGTYQKGFEGTFRGMSKGEHEITMKVATHDHKDLPASDTVRIVVE